jgi:GAF domain-containing protein
MTLLNNLSSVLVREGKDLKTCLNHALETAIAITTANKGNVQLFDGNSVALTIAAHRGFEDNFLKFFEEVRNDSTVCAEAMRSAQRVIVEDVTRSEIFAAAPLSLKVLVEAGVRAVKSTPLTSGDGSLLGMISVHFMEPHRPAERALGLMDLLARQTADYLERKRAEEVEQYPVREVQHRSNNLLAVIQEIAHRSLYRRLAAAKRTKHHQYDTFRKSSTGPRLIEELRRSPALYFAIAGFGVASTTTVTTAETRSLRHVFGNRALSFKTTWVALRRRVQPAMRGLAVYRPVASLPQ